MVGEAGLADSVSEGERAHRDKNSKWNKIIYNQSTIEYTMTKS